MDRVNAQQILNEFGMSSDTDFKRLRDRILFPDLLAKCRRGYASTELICHRINRLFDAAGQFECYHSYVNFGKKTYSHKLPPTE